MSEFTPRERTIIVEALKDIVRELRGLREGLVENNRSEKSGPDGVAESQQQRLASEQTQVGLL